MNFDIKGALLEQIIALADKLQTTVAEFLHRAILAGMNALEREPQGHTEPIEGQLVTMATRQHFLPSPLTEKQKAFVKTNIAVMKNPQIAARLQCTVMAVIQAKNEIIESFIRARWEQMTDGEMGRALGFHKLYISIRRRQLGLLRRRGRTSGKKSYAALTKERLEKMLTQEGLTLEKIGRNNGLSRERIRQIAVNLGVKRKRRPIWWAKKWGKPELGDRAWVKRALAAKGRVSAIAASLALPHGKVKKICLMHGITLPVYKGRVFQGLVELHCDQCNGLFLRKNSVQRGLKKKGIKHHFCRKKCYTEWLETHRGELRIKKTGHATGRETVS
ncbi:MAG: hypothetical protein Greene041679_25 [Parcubacteria group bacterium Greene0416_79]|nr:MAG: hypothetical protein Greene041679_25 [Parcubacteria group bacterium Greene0416_79]